MIAALDTNCLLRWLLGDIPDQAKKIDLFLQDPDNTAHVADMAVAEVVWVLQSVYEFSRPEIADAIHAITANSRINCNRKVFEEAMPLYVKRHSISFVDACLASYAILSDCDKLFTFDKKLAAALPLVAVQP